MVVEAYDIEYDTGGDHMWLPMRLTFLVDESFDCEEDLAQLIIDQVGYFVTGYKYRITSVGNLV